MTPSKQCPKCGTVLPPDAPASVCPKCLLQAGMDEIEEAAGDDVTLITNPELNVNRPDEPATEPDVPKSSRVEQIGTTLRYFGDYELLYEIARGGKCKFTYHPPYLKKCRSWFELRANQCWWIVE